METAHARVEGGTSRSCLVSVKRGQSISFNVASPNEPVTMATAVRMSNTTSDSLTTELSRTVVPCALKNNSWLVYN